MTNPVDHTDTLSPPIRPRTRFKMARSIGALILREMSTTYGRSPGGYVWAIFQPVSLIIVLAIGFSLLLRSPPLGTNFLMFYASGLLPLRMFQVLSSNVGNAVTFSKPLLFYPRVTFVDAILGRAILAVLTQFLVALIIFTAVRLLTEASEFLTLSYVIEAYAMTIALGVGIGCLNCFLFVVVPVWRILWGIVTGPLILISAVIYIFEDLPTTAQNILWFNPLVHVTGLSRVGFYSTYSPTYIDPAYVMACALIPGFFGVMLLRKYIRAILFL